MKGKEVTDFVGRDELDESLLGLVVVGRGFGLVRVVLQMLPVRYVFPYMLSHEPFIQVGSSFELWQRQPCNCQ